MHQPSSPSRGLIVLAFALPVFLAACGKREPAQAPQAPAVEAAAPAAPVAQAPDLAQYAPVVQYAYLAYFGRPADAAGMDYWGKQLQAANAPTDPAALAGQYAANAGVRAVLDAFANSDEARLLYPGSTRDFVAAVYRNLFQRDADQAGLDYWTQAIDKGVITRSQAALSIMNGAQHKDPGTLRSKLAVADAFTRAFAERPEAAAEYKGEADNKLARAMMAKVNGTTEVAAFDAQIRETIAQMAKAQ